MRKIARQEIVELAPDLLVYGIADDLSEVEKPALFAASRDQNMRSASPESRSRLSLVSADSRMILLGMGGSFSTTGDEQGDRIAALAITPRVGLFARQPPILSGRE